MKTFVCTLTPNPALDVGGIVTDLKPNEKSYVQDQTINPGGNAINVARILVRLGVPVLATGFLGGSIGQEIKSLLDEENVKNEFVKIMGRSRIGVTVSNRKDHNQTRLTFPGPVIQKKEQQDLLDLISRKNGVSLLVIGGSFPPGFSSRSILHLMKLARDRSIETVVDCPAKILRHAISGHPLLIKPNLIEFQELIGKNVNSIGAVHAQAKKLLDRVPMICVSSVEGGAIFVTQNRTYFGCIPKTKIRSTVGAGDSMVGAMVSQLYQKNRDPGDLLRWGLAAAAATLCKPGTELGSTDRIIHFYEKTKVHLV